jgi:pyrroline-5-carboxylate reductase
MNIGIIGYGSMGSMLVEKLSKNKDNRLYVYNRTIEKLKSLSPEINICSSNSDLASKVDVVIMCVRPFDIKVVLSEISDSLRAETLIVSLNGSVSFASMEKIINHKMAKVIPSLTAEIEKSQTLICFNEKTCEDDKT